MKFSLLYLSFWCLLQTVCTLRTEILPDAFYNTYYLLRHPDCGSNSNISSPRDDSILLHQWLLQGWTCDHSYQKFLELLEPHLSCLIRDRITRKKFFPSMLLFVHWMWSWEAAFMSQWGKKYHWHNTKDIMKDRRNTFSHIFLSPVVGTYPSWYSILWICQLPPGHQWPWKNSLSEVVEMEV